MGAPVSSQHKSRGICGLEGAAPRNSGTSSRAIGKVKLLTDRCVTDQSTAAESEEEGDAIEYDSLLRVSAGSPKVLAGEQE
jgi:hypothetical protein